MRLLLDTHIWIWAALEPRRLGRRTAAAISDPDSQLWLSPVSVIEFRALHAKRRFPTIKNASLWLNEALSAPALRDAPVTRRIELEVAEFSLPHCDPADLLLVATARVMNLTLVTEDRQIIASKAIDVMPND